MADINVGSCVQLKSGGPHMTVNSIGDDYGILTAYVSWFDDKNQPQKGGYPVTSLDSVD